VWEAHYTLPFLGIKADLGSIPFPDSRLASLLQPKGSLRGKATSFFRPHQTHFRLRGLALSLVLRLFLSVVRVGRFGGVAMGGVAVGAIVVALGAAMGVVALGWVALGGVALLAVSRLISGCFLSQRVSLVAGAGAARGTPLVLRWPALLLATRALALSTFLVEESAVGPLAIALDEGAAVVA
jgi:hypothetical protein